jgi:hypothetical protein
MFVIRERLYAHPVELYMFRTLSLSIIRILALYTQQWVYILQVMLTVC